MGHDHGRVQAPDLGPQAPCEARIEPHGGAVPTPMIEGVVDVHLPSGGEQAHEPVVADAGEVEACGEGARFALGPPGDGGGNDVQHERNARSAPRAAAGPVTSLDPRGSSCRPPR